MTKLIIFDLDGTLLDTIHDLASATNLVLTQYGYPTHETSAYRYFIGKGVDNLIKCALPEATRTPDMIATIKEEQLRYYNQHMDCLTCAFSGIAQTLTKLNQQGIALAVATNKPHLFAVALMTRFFPSIPFISILGQTDGFPKKPNPAVVNRIISDFGCNKDEVLYCGDSDVDMVTAKNAGVVGIGVLWGYRSKEELETSGAAHLIDRPEELFDIIEC